MGTERRERAPEEVDDLRGLDDQLVVAERLELQPVRRELGVLAEALHGDLGELPAGELVAARHLELDRLVEELAGCGLRVVRERRALPGEDRAEEALAPAQVGEVGLAEPERLGEVERARGVLDAVAQALRQARREGRPLSRPDQGLHRAALDRRELHRGGR